MRYLSSRGSDRSAAGGGRSDLSEWQRSADAKEHRRRRQMPGTATGRPMYCHAVRNSPGDCCRHKERARISPDSFVFALPIFPGSHPPSIVGVHVLNFCVRDGNRWTHMTINTNSYGWALTHRLYQSSCELRYLVTHTGFEPMLTA